MQYIIPYIQQRTKTSDFPSKTNTFSPDRGLGGPELPPILHPFDPLGNQVANEAGLHW